MNTTLKPIPELDNLPDDQREQLHEWIETLGYIKTIAKLKQDWDLSITYNKIRRYYQRQLDKADIDQALEDELTVPQYLDLLNGRSIPYDKAGIQRIMQRAYHLVGEHGHSPTKLATLLRVLHYNQNREWTNKRIEISDRFAKVREEELALKNPRSQNQSAIRNPNSAIPCDHLGPHARNWDEVGERARIHFDVSKEEWARRQALHDTPHPNLNLTPNPAPSHPTNLPTPATEKSEIINHKSEIKPDSDFGPRTSDLSSTVLSYTVQRAQEYWAWRRAVAALPDNQPHPPYTTKHRHCPCGKPTPCSEHENETCGELPTFFWSISPHLRAYEICLTARNLPYLEPCECVPEEFRIYDSH